MCMLIHLYVYDIVLTLHMNTFLFLILSRIYKTSLKYFQALKQYFKAPILLHIRQQFVWDQVHESTEGLANIACTML